MAVQLLTYGSESASFNEAFAHLRFGIGFIN